MNTERTWTYEQATGMWFHPTGEIAGRGYAGRGIGKNNPDMQNVKGVGPLPRGLYIAGEPRDDPKVGQFAMRLTPSPDTVMFGRSAFFLHGDSRWEPGNASEGCIVLPRNLREAFWNSGDHNIQVTHG